MLLWFTVKVMPATVSVPVLGEPVLLVATLYETVPLPIPPDPEVIVSHESLLIACHPQPAGVVTLMVPFPPLAEKDALVGEIIRGGFEAVKFTLEELLPATGSRTTEVTDAVLLTVWPLVTVQFRVATIVVTADEPAAKEANVTTRLLPEPPQTPPPVDEHETKLSEAGKLSVNVIELAVSGPLLDKVIVKVTLLPTTIVPEDATLTTLRSAAPKTMHPENSEVLPEALVAVAVVDSPAAADPGTFTLNVAL